MAVGNEIRKFFDSKAGVRASFVIATNVVREMQSIQNTFPIATNAIGRAMVGAALLASHQKKGQIAGLHFKGDGPLGMFYAEASFEGELRGYTPNPQLELDLIDGKIPLGPAIGEGVLTVTRTLGKEPPQKGSVKLQSGEVGDDIAYFLQQSDQIHSSVSLGVKINAYGKVEAAGGVLLEMLPGADRSVGDQLIKNLEAVGSLSERIAAGEDVDSLNISYLSGLDVIEIDHPYELSYTCRCNKQKLTEAMGLFPSEELTEMVDRGEPIVAKCEVCGRSYELETEVINGILQKIKKENLH